MFNPWITEGTKCTRPRYFRQLYSAVQSNSLTIFLSICSSKAPLTQNYHYAAWMLFLGQANFFLIRLEHFVPNLSYNPTHALFTL
jgi:hypothetical protein